MPYEVITDLEYFEKYISPGGRLGRFRRIRFRGWLLHHGERKIPFYSTDEVNAKKDEHKLSHKSIVSSVEQLEMAFLNVSPELVVEEIIRSIKSELKQQIKKKLKKEILNEMKNQDSSGK